MDLNGAVSAFKDLSITDTKDGKRILDASSENNSLSPFKIDGKKLSGHSHDSQSEPRQRTRSQENGSTATFLTNYYLSHHGLRNLPETRARRRHQTCLNVGHSMSLAKMTTLNYQKKQLLSVPPKSLSSRSPGVGVRDNSVQFKSTSNSFYNDINYRYARNPTSSMVLNNHSHMRVNIIYIDNEITDEDEDHAIPNQIDGSYKEAKNKSSKTENTSISLNVRDDEDADTGFRTMTWTMSEALGKADVFKPSNGNKERRDACREVKAKMLADGQKLEKPTLNDFIDTHYYDLARDVNRGPRDQSKKNKSEISDSVRNFGKCQSRSKQFIFSKNKNAHNKLDKRPMKVHDGVRNEGSGVVAQRNTCSADGLCNSRARDMMHFITNEKCERTVISNILKPFKIFNPNYNQSKHTSVDHVANDSRASNYSARLCRPKIYPGKPVNKKIKNAHVPVLGSICENCTLTVDDEAETSGLERVYLVYVTDKLLSWIRTRDPFGFVSLESPTNGWRGHTLRTKELFKDQLRQKEICEVLYHGRQYLQTHWDSELKVLVRNLEIHWRQFQAVALHLGNQPIPRKILSSSTFVLPTKHTTREPHNHLLRSNTRRAEHTSYEHPADCCTGKEKCFYWHIKSFQKSNSKQNHHTQSARLKQVHLKQKNLPFSVLSRKTFKNHLKYFQKKNLDNLSPLIKQILEKFCIWHEKMETLKNRSPNMLRRLDGYDKPSSPVLNKLAQLRDKKSGSNPDLRFSCPDSPSEAKRRRMGRDDISITSTISSQFSSRSHSPTFSESTLDDSYMSTPGNSPAATLKDQLRKHYRKYELNLESDLMDFDCMMDADLLAACKSADSDEETLNSNMKVSLTEFTQQYRELSAWLTQVLQVTKRSMGTQVLSEKYLTQSYHEELLKQSPRHKLFNDYAKQLLQRRPSLKEEITQRLNHVNSQWDAVEKAVSCRDIWQDTDTILRDLEEDIMNLRKWLDGVEQRLTKSAIIQDHQPEDIHRKILEHQVLQKDIESKSRNVSAVLKLCERLRSDPLNDQTASKNQLYLESLARNLQWRWHSIWLQSVEILCKLENAQNTKKANFPSPLYFAGSPGWLNSKDQSSDKGSYDSGTEDSLCLFSRPGDFVESPQLDSTCGSLDQASDTHSGKDSAVPSEVEGKMSSEHSDSDLEGIRQSKSETTKDIGYSSGTTDSLGHLSTESDCEDIKKLIDGAEKLVKTESPVAPSPKKIESSCDASSEESDGEQDVFSTASDEEEKAEALFDSLLGLDYQSDVSVPNTLPPFYNTVKFRQHRRRKDRPWSSLFVKDIEGDGERTSMCWSETAIDRLSYGSDSQSATPQQRIRGPSKSLKQAGAKRKLYESSTPQEFGYVDSSESDTESSGSDGYETANKELMTSDEEDCVQSTGSFSEGAWDNYHQVYSSMGEEQDEQLISWPKLEEDLMFDDIYPTNHQADMERRKRLSKPRLHTQSSQLGYDSDSDLEDFNHFLETSEEQLRITDRCLKKKRKDQYKTGIALHTNKYAEIIATCQTNIKCLQDVSDHLNPEIFAVDIKKIKDLIYQWEKLHAFACERQQQSQFLSWLCRSLEETSTDVLNCDVYEGELKFSSYQEADCCLRNSQSNRDILNNARRKISELSERAEVFQQDHGAINMDHINRRLGEIDMIATRKLDRAHRDLLELQEAHILWGEYTMTEDHITKSLDQLSSSNIRASFEAYKNGSKDTLIPQHPSKTLEDLTKLMSRLQLLRGQLLPYIDDHTKAALTSRLADLHTQLFEAQGRCHALEQEYGCAVREQEEDSLGRVISEEIITPETISSSLSAEAISLDSDSALPETTSWLRSGYFKAAAVFMVMGVAYMVDPDILKHIGDLTVTISPELRYVNGPPPM